MRNESCVDFNIIKNGRYVVDIKVILLLLF